MKLNFFQVKIKNKKLILLVMLSVVVSTCLFSQPIRNIRVDTVRWKDGSYTLDKYLNDTLIHRSSYFKDNTQEQIIGNYNGSGGYYKQFYSNGNVKFEGFEYEGNWFGLWIFWNELGQRELVQDKNYEDNTIVETHYDYYETGVIKSISKYKGKLYNVVPDSTGCVQRVFNKKENLTKTGVWLYFSEFGEIIDRKKYD